MNLEISLRKHEQYKKYQIVHKIVRKKKDEVDRWSNTSTFLDRVKKKSKRSMLLVSTTLVSYRKLDRTWC